MHERAVKVDETLVLGDFPARTHAFVRVANPNQPVMIIPETLLVIEDVPPTHVRFFRDRIEAGFTAYVRFVSIRSRGDGVNTEALDLQRVSVLLDELPTGLAVRVRHIPLYAQQPFQTMIFPHWQMPPSKLPALWWHRSLNRNLH